MIMDPDEYGQYAERINDVLHNMDNLLDPIYSQIHQAYIRGDLSSNYWIAGNQMREIAGRELRRRGLHESGCDIVMGILHNEEMIHLSWVQEESGKVYPKWTVENVRGSHAKEVIRYDILMTAGGVG